MNVRPAVNFARMTLGAFLPACLTLVACSATPGTDSSSAGTSGVGSGGRSAGGGSGNGSNGGSGSSSFAGSGAGSLAGAGNGAGGSSGNTSFAGSSGSSNGGSGNSSFGGKANGGSGGTTGAAGGKANGGAGGKANGGSGGTTGAAGGSTAGAPALDCAAVMPTGGTPHTSTNMSGKAAGLDWTIWSNGMKAGTITTYATPAFSAAWNDSGDFLARVGLQWNATKTYDQLGTITAQFAAKKNGTGGTYSYIGIYGWSVSPCVEWYIVDDSYNKMPVNPGSTTNMGTAMIDGGTYTLYKRTTNGTGGSKCGSQATWDQYYSIRQTARSCGQISISEHFAKWSAANMPLGKMDQAQILVEVGGGEGSVDFSTANVTATP